MRFPAMVGTGTPPMYAVPPGNGHALDVSGHLAELLRANQTLSPYTQSPRHIALRTAPGHHNVRSGRAHARQRRKFSLNSES
jgi:mitochondrial distribution and morphology protein 34